MSPALRDMLAVLRRDLDDDLKQQLKTLEVRLSDLAREFGEQRETDGYVTGMRTALRSGSDAQVHSLHRVPPAG
jgi:hypothetical protein